MTIMHELHSQNIQVEGSIADTMRWTGPRTLDQLVDFITKGIYLPGEITMYLVKPSPPLQCFPPSVRDCLRNPSPMVRHSQT
jgi:hypothetical protein